MKKVRGYNVTVSVATAHIACHTNHMIGNIYKFTQGFAWHSVLCASLFVPVAWSQEFPPADRELRQGMSYEEYSAHREKMRLRMEKSRTDDQARPSDTQKPQVEHTEKPRADGAYGQGFHTRNRIENRQDRPRLDRQNRVDRRHR